MSRMGSTSIHDDGGGRPTRVTIERDGVEQTIVFGRFFMNVDRDYAEIVTMATDAPLRQHFYLTGNETWKFEGSGTQVHHDRVEEPVLERYVAVYEFSRRFMNELGYVLDVDDAEQLEEACKTISELTDMRDRLQGALDVLAGTKTAVDPNEYLDEEDEVYPDD